jgi:hypothetical protein
MLKPVSNKNNPKAVSHLLEMPHRKSVLASINHEQGKGLFVKMKDRFVGAITGSKPSSAKGEDLSLGKTDDTVKSHRTGTSSELSENSLAEANGKRRG